MLTNASMCDIIYDGHNTSAYVLIDGTAHIPNTRSAYKDLSGSAKIAPKDLTNYSRCVILFIVNKIYGSKQDEPRTTLATR